MHTESRAAGSAEWAKKTTTMGAPYGYTGNDIIGRDKHGFRVEQRDYDGFEQAVPRTLRTV
jgi:hypothetical protein